VRVGSNVHELVTDGPGKLRESRKRTTGSAMSDKQVARAAVNGQMIVFRTGLFVPVEGYIIVEGYVVGMDDYHWLVATPSDDRLPVQTVLVHKTCPLVTFIDQHLADETEDDRKKIQTIGNAFWDYCVTTGLTRSVPATA
jgi:hypothetical protein